MNNKGFTLIELLAVIVILASLSLVAVASISSSLERRDTKECQEQIDLAKNAAKIYFSLNNCNDFNCNVSVKTLRDNNYFDDTRKNDRLNDSDTIKFTSSGYVYTGECK